MDDKQRDGEDGDYGDGTRYLFKIVALRRAVWLRANARCILGFGIFIFEKEWVAWEAGNIDFLEFPRFWM